MAVLKSHIRRNPDMALIDRSAAIWKRLMLELVFGP